MQRLFRASAGIRAARLSAWAAPSGQPIIVQRVKLTRARNLFRTFLIGGGVTYLCWNIYSSAVLTPLFRHIETEYASLSEKERRAIEKEKEESDGSIFIAFPFTTTLIPAKPYKPTDPEWLQFLEISRDHDLQERLRRELAQLVGDTIERFSWRDVGKNPRVRRYWLDIGFPSRPSPTFQRSGILVDDMGIYWATEPVDSYTVFRLQSILWPVAVAQSSWAFTTAMVKQHWAELTKALGFQASQPPPATPQSMMEAVARSKLPTSRRQTPDGGSPVDPPQDNAVDKAADARPSDTVRSGGRTKFLNGAMSSHVDGVRGMSSGPFMEFRKVLGKTWQPTPAFPPRGSIRVGGYVEVETEKSVVVAEVETSWNPKTRKFDGRTTHIHVKRVGLKPPH
ncbi:hypothetical protein ACRALDRAFT_1075562 [Sodiomyces alcalophilus JCM 7366]|uniref:uncharacterized protein n=1 Tax=Sodiomyces alcalophilus JCM 7366 TaxID=591952 RepID=UPI0039B3FB10